MAGSHVVFSVEDEAVRQMLVRQAELPGSELMSRIGEYLLASTQARFKTQTAPDGTPVNAVRGLLEFLTRLLRDYAPTQLAACWDDDWRPQFRVDALPSYKAQRVAAEGEGE